MIDFRQERAPVAQPRDIHACGRPQTVHPEVRSAGIARDLPGIAPRAEKTGVLSGPHERTFHEKGRQVDAAGHAIRARPEMVEGRSIARPVVA